jgi:hypothetical protein
MTALTVVLPLRAISVLNVREHWSRRARRASEQRAVTRMALASQRAWPLHLPVEVTITRIAPRALDGDNLQGSLKAIRDGIADALGLDDRHAAIRWSYEQRRGAARQYAVELCIVEVTEPVIGAAP